MLVPALWVRTGHKPRKRHGLTEILLNTTLSPIKINTRKHAQIRTLAQYVQTLHLFILLYIQMNATTSIFKRQICPSRCHRRRLVEVAIRGIFEREYLFDNDLLPFLYIKLLQSLDDVNILSHVEAIIARLDGEILSVVFIWKRLRAFLLVTN